MASRLFILDGHSLIFKMYYAFLRRPMINSKGVDTSILFGFTKYLLELIDREYPTHLAVAFDPPGGTFRNELYAGYKANRAETPQLVIDALEPLTEICKAMNIPVLMVPGYEADDVIGTVATRFASDVTDVFMITPDKDYGQLIGPHIWQYKPKTGAENELIGQTEVCARYGIDRPSQVIDILTICGDSSDNVPGVRGIGEVWAGKLLSRYGSVENIYANIDELPEKQSMMFRDAMEHVALSKTLVTIKTDVPVEVTLPDMKLNMNYSPEIADLFAKYEFASLKRYISHILTTDSASIPITPQEVLQVRTANSFQIMQYACLTGKCAIYVEPETPGIFSPIKFLTVSTVYKDTPVAAKGNVREFKNLLEDSAISKFGYGLKNQISLIAGEGIRVCGKLKDIELMHYLLDPEKSHSLDIIIKSYLGIDINPDMSGGMVGSLFDEQPEQSIQTEDRFAEAASIMLAGPKIWSDMQESSLISLYEKIEGPLIKVLSGMERDGVKVDVAFLGDFARLLEREIREKEETIRELAGEPNLNVSSVKQIGEVLFEKLKLDPSAKKNSKSNWRVDEETLVNLRDKSPIINAILEFRAVKKLLSTYIEPFPDYVSPYDGRVHTSFNQALTATGRLSSSNPNLQNIPIRTERGKEIRKAFVPETPDGLIMSADYSQIELRIMAHLCGDEHLVQAFLAGEDVHAATAAKIFKIPLGEVTSDQRRIAKTANFGIMYGISAFGLAQRLKVSRTEAKEIIDNYFNSFPAISDFISGTVASARENGYVETLFGRRRYIRDINSHNATLRAIAERNAVNAPIQGTAADIIKLAMIRVDKSLKEKRLKSKMVLQIHDELLFETSPDEVALLKEIVIRDMENVIKLSVPLTVECNYGKNWLEAH